MLNISDNCMCVWVNDEVTLIDCDKIQETTTKSCDVSIFWVLFPRSGSCCTQKSYYELLPHCNNKAHGAENMGGHMS